MKKLITLSLLSLAAFGLVSCGETPIEAAVANERIVAAAAKTASTDVASFVLNIAAEVNASNVFDYVDSEEADENYSMTGSGSLELRANDIWGDAEASLHVEATVTESEPGSSMSMTQTGNAYLKDEYLYVDASAATDLLEISSGEDTRVKMLIGNLSDLLGMPSEVSSISEEIFDMEQLTPFLTDIEDVKATEKNGDLTVTYNITIDDMVNLYIDMIEMQEGVDLNSFTSSQISEIMSSIRGEIESVLTLTEMKFVIGVSKDGYFNKFYIDCDMDLNIEETEYDYSLYEDYVVGTNHVSIDGFLHIDLTNVNETVTVTFPADLDDYVEVEGPGTGTGMVS